MEIAIFLLASLAAVITVAGLIGFVTNVLNNND